MGLSLDSKINWSRDVAVYPPILRGTVLYSASVAMSERDRVLSDGNTEIAREQIRREIHQGVYDSVYQRIRELEKDVVRLVVGTMQTPGAPSGDIVLGKIRTLIDELSGLGV